MARLSETGDGRRFILLLILLSLWFHTGCFSRDPVFAITDVLDFAAVTINQLHISCGNGLTVNTVDSALIAECLESLKECLVTKHKEAEEEEREGPLMEVGFNYRATLSGDAQTIYLSPGEVSFKIDADTQIYDIRKDDQEQILAMLERLFNSLNTREP